MAKDYNPLLAYQRLEASKQRALETIQRQQEMIKKKEEEKQQYFDRHVIHALKKYGFTFESWLELEEVLKVMKRAELAPRRLLEVIPLLQDEDQSPNEEGL